MFWQVIPLKIRSSEWRMETPFIKTVTLNVSDLERQLEFYQQVIGLRLLTEEDGRASLGAAPEAPLLVLQQKSGGQYYPRHTGLYHFAILVPSQFHLALSLHRLITTNTSLQGASDHLVSEALYLADPEGNGIEIYRDRPRAEWNVNGHVQMATLPLDFDGVMAKLETGVPPWQGLDPDTVIGHIHLHVGDIPAARQFYTQLLDMQEMATMPSATFLSYEGYHHHVGANTWSGRTPPPPDALGLDRFSMQVSPERLAYIQEQFQRQGHEFQQLERGIRITDPSMNVIEVLG